MADSPTLKLKGGKQLDRLFEELPKRTAKRGMRQAANAGTTPILKAARAKVPVESGLLKQSLKKKIKNYALSCVGIVGADRALEGEYLGRKRVPAKYIALVDQGHGGKHPAPPHPFLEAAIDESGSAAQQAATDKLAAFIEKEAEKLRSEQ